MVFASGLLLVGYKHREVVHGQLKTITNLLALLVKVVQQQFVDQVLQRLLTQLRLDGALSTKKSLEVLELILSYELFTQLDKIEFSIKVIFRDEVQSKIHLLWNFDHTIDLFDKIFPKVLFGIGQRPQIKVQRFVLVRAILQTVKPV